MSTARENHIASINALLVKYDATLDRWGMYHIGKYKFDTRKVNLKITVNDLKILSTSMSKLTLEEFEKRLKIYVARESESKWADITNFSKK